MGSETAPAGDQMLCYISTGCTELEISIGAQKLWLVIIKKIRKR